MDFDISPNQTQWLKRVVAFMDEHIYPAIPTYEAEMNVLGAERWKVVQVVEDLKKKAKAAGLWNFFMPPHSGQSHVDDEFQFEGHQLSNLEYSMIAEQMGKVGFASEVFNCSAPDTGNMEVLMRYGTLAQKERWLRPLMNGEIRSAFLMTEPLVASSDATNIETRIERDGDDYVINGRKWWSSGVGDPRCKLAIVMGKTNPNAASHQQQSQILVPLDAPGVKVARMLPVFGYDDAPHGHAEVLLENVRVAAARTDIEMTRLLCLKAADMMDKAGNKVARLEISMIKVAAPNMALRIIDDAIQAHGGAGVTTDFGLARMYASQRTLRLADGPDEVHNRTIARMEFAKYGDLHAKVRAERDAMLLPVGAR